MCIQVLHSTRGGVGGTEDWPPSRDQMEDSQGLARAGKWGPSHGPSNRRWSTFK